MMAVLHLWRHKPPSYQLLYEGMAVFMLNICKFNDCGLTFQNLGDLIQHIEESHIGKLY